MDFDEFALVQSDEDCETPSKPIRKINSVQQKREDFRHQIRREQIEEEIEKRRMWFLPQSGLVMKPISHNKSSIEHIFNQFKIAYQESNDQQIAQFLHTINTIYTQCDVNRIHSLYLTQRNFLSYKRLLIEETFYLDTYAILTQLTQDEEFYQSNIQDLQYSVDCSISIMKSSKDHGLNNLIYGYLANLASRLVDIQLMLLEKEALLYITMQLELLDNICYFSQTISKAIPQNYNYQSMYALKLFENLPENLNVLQTYFIILKQAPYFDEYDYTSLLQYLLQYINKYINDETHYQEFYCALAQLKRLSEYDSQNLLNLISTNLSRELLFQLISYKYLKIRTCGLFILLRLQLIGGTSINIVTEQEQFMPKLLFILEQDKPVNKSLVLQFFIDILKCLDCHNINILLTTTDLLAQIAVILKSQLDLIISKALECILLIAKFCWTSSENPTLQIINMLENNHIFRILENLQAHPNPEYSQSATKSLELLLRNTI